MSISTNVNAPPLPIMGIPAPADPSSVSLTRLVSVLWARKIFIACTTIVLVCLASWVILALPDAYVSTASVLVGTQSSVGDQSVSDNKTASTTDSVAIRTQVDLQKSFSLARQVTLQLDLVHTREFEAAITPHQGLVRRIVALARELTGRPPLPPLDADSTIDLATELLLSKMTFVNDGRSYVINIGAKTSDPRLSAEIANTYAANYIDFTKKVKTDAIAHASSWFDARLTALRNKVNAADAAVQTFRADYGLIQDRGGAPGIGTGVTVLGQQMSQINNQLSIASSAYAEKAASLAQIRSALASGASLDSIPAVVASSLIQHYREQLADVSGKIAHLAITRSDNDPGMRSLHAEQNDINGRIAAEVHNIAASVANEVNAAKAREDTLARQLADLQVQVSGQGKSEVRLSQLQSEAEAARSIYTSYLNWFERTSNEIGLQTPDAQLISSASPAIGAVPPSKRQLVAVSVLISAIIAMALALVREGSLRGFQTPAQLESQTGLPAIGILPERKTLRLGRTGTARRFDDAVTLTRSMLQHRGASNSPQVILLTSAVPREGKTFFAVALAKNAAAAGSNTLLIDCDLRRPAVAAQLGMQARHGLENIRADGGCRVQTFTGTGDAQPFDVITAAPGTANPQDLLASSEVQTMLSRARSLYDLIILDAPPVLGFADARVLSTVSDSTLLVVQWGRTSPKLVSAAIAALRLYGARITGAVMNQVADGNQISDDTTPRAVARRYHALLK